ncbi:hypothetical protein [Mycolicibacterium peregrinum]|uniref:hypothetical protein n=1 Tax=Mycolicibacterium peregrinum TaxID=43304 RepID=UPI003AAC534E
MTSAVIEVGPVTVRGPGPLAADVAAIAVAGIDDEIALIEDEPVAVSESVGRGSRCGRCRGRDAHPGVSHVVDRRPV